MTEDEVALKREELELRKRETALNHAWLWFSLHAGQRLQALNFFLLSSGFLISGYGYSLKENPDVSGFIATSGCVLCLVFIGLERRTRQLVVGSQDALKPLQKSLSESVGVEFLEILEKTDKPEFPGLKYSKLIPLAEFVLFALFVVAACYAFRKEAPTFPAPTQPTVQSTPVA